MITLYGGPTTNTHKVSIALAELGLSFSPHPVNLPGKEQMSDWFLALSPNNKIPVLADGATGITVYESGAILLYLADHYDTESKILAKSGAARYAAIQAAFFQAANIGPNLGRLNEQLAGPEDKKNPQMLALYFAEAVRLASVLDRMLADGRHYLAGEYSIADIMHYPWLKPGIDMGFAALVEKPNIVAWLRRIGEREAVQTGMSAFR
jgi:glutathione S-transferase